MIKRTIYFGNPAKLSTSQGQLVVLLPQSEGKEEKRSLPIEDLGYIILDSPQITITHAAIQALLDNNCAIITCDDHHLPSGLMLPLNRNSLQTERWHEQINCSQPLRKQLWQQTVQAKILNQAAALRKCRGENIRNMIAWASEVKTDDSQNLEARAAAYYWSKMFPEDDDFVRGRYEDCPNNLLNYGYAILRAVVARSLVASGLLPSFGIHHRNRHNAYCLADDIMEPYRPFVDNLVVEIVKRHGIENVEELTTSLKRELLTIPMLDVQIGRERKPLMLAVAKTTLTLQKCFAGEARKIAYPVI